MLNDDETGHEALRLSKGFNRRVIAIKQQLDQEDHPIHKIVMKFN